MVGGRKLKGARPRTINGKGDLGFSVKREKCVIEAREIFRANIDFSEACIHSPGPPLLAMAIGLLGRRISLMSFFIVLDTDHRSTIYFY
jgi:hypothetical protein